MLLVIDVGNTNTVMGVYDDSRLVCGWRIRTEKNATEDEFNLLLKGLFSGSDIRLSQVKKTIISSVVPSMAMILNAFCLKYMGREPFWVNARSAAAWMPILYKNPSEVGADRIVNSVAAFHKYRKGMVIIDFGTATTFDAVSEKGEYLGGAISPGIAVSSEALFNKASKLPRVELLKLPDRVVGRETSESIQAGIIFGYAGLVDGIVRRMKKELGGDPFVIATGGLAPLMEKASETILSVEPDLTLEGLRIIGEGS
ncbi:Type III pantothenate kinase [Candidatus Desulfarcum epimagneticum]|uniref:Type III pantothenate kinase n=1 Tax=uncultured Desulfobacteraceae bacterium TaxID=218296 RepID=A0A484HQ79_9BACT|nr:Type III pantothenate kinase [uncultured Desulfobacteraceae bacterium]